MTDHAKLLAVSEVLSEYFQFDIYAPSPAYAEIGPWRMWFSIRGEIIAICPTGSTHRAFQDNSEILEWVQKFYPNHSRDEMREKLGIARKTLDDYITKLSAMGHLPPPKKKPTSNPVDHVNWTDKKNQYLMERYYVEGAEECAKRLHTTPGAVKTQASRLGITG